jgi:outer membrane protein, multidrug efflux system
MDERFRGAALKAPAVGSEAPPAEEVAVALAQGRRPDLLALIDQADALKLGAKATAAAARPSLALRASITQQNDAARDMFKKQSQIYMAGVAVSWDAFGLLRTPSKVAELKANERAARQTQRAAVEGVALEVRSALLSVREARERVSVEERALTVAEEQARVARLAYREGLITSVEAQDAELALTAARFDLLRARRDGAVADSRLSLALGE